MSKSNLFLSCVLFLSLIVGIGVGLNHDSSPAALAAPTDAAWFDRGWGYRRAVTVTCPCAQDQTDYQVQVLLNNTFDYNHAKTDASDFRVTASDGVTQIPFWIESWNPPNDASIWVKVPVIPTGSGTTIYLYYGNANPTNNPVEVPPIGPWTRPAGNPIVPIGGPANGRSLLAENIVYDDVTHHYWMVHANYNDGGVGLVWSDTPTDPASWHWYGTVISPANAPHILKYNGTWYIFYSAWPNIRVATSTNVSGPYSNNTLILSPLPNWETARVDEPFVFRRNDGKWVLMYMGDSGGAHEQVSYATADDLLGPYTRYSDTTPFIPFGPGGSFDAGTVADPWVVEFHGTYYIGYTVSPTTSSPWQTAYATTTDWVTLTKHGITLPLAPSGWDSSNAFRGAVTRIGDTYVFPYTGDGYQMGIATQPVYMTMPVNQEASVFPFFDEFNGTALDTTKWVTPPDNGTISQLSFSGNYLRMTADATYYSKIHGNTSFGMDYLVEAYARDLQGGQSQMIPEIGFVQGTGFDNSVRLVADFHAPFTNWEYQAFGGAPWIDIWTYPRIRTGISSAFID